VLIGAAIGGEEAGEGLVVGAVAEPVLPRSLAVIALITIDLDWVRSLHIPEILGTTSP
jgi:hypothetical protein